MGEFGPMHWLVVLGVIVLFFGGRKIPEVMRGLGEGIRSFKEGMHGTPTGTPTAGTTTAPPPTPTVTEEKK
jgi:sec-independent protein translocase protein TatA